MIEKEVRDDVTILRLAHGKASAFDLELCEAMATAFQALVGAKPGPVVITGTGRIFSAGVDLLRILDGGRDYLARFLPAFDRAMRSLLFLERPVVAAMNGHAIAGGCVLACACDRRILAAGTSTVGCPELRVGVPFPQVALESVRSVLAPYAFQEAVNVGRIYTAEEARALGLVDELAEPETLLERALDQARELGSIPPRSFAVHKRMVRRPVRDLVDRHDADIGNERGEMLDTWSSPEVLAAMRTYVDATLRK